MGRAALFLVSGFLIIFGMVQNSVQNRQQVLAERSPEYYYEEQSRNIAYSMMEVVIAEFNNNSAWTPQNNPYDIMGGTGTVTINDTEAFGSRVFLTIKGITGAEDNKIKTTIKAVANRPAFSIYSYFTHEEPVIYFADGDVINGPVHTNGTFHIDGDPVFNGRVTSPNEPEEEWGSDPEYRQGANFNAESIDLPEDLAELSDEAIAGGLRFDKQIEIEFKDNGTVTIKEFQQGCEDWDDHPYIDDKRYCDRYGDKDILSTRNYTLTDYNGIVSSSERVEVKGTLDGSVTLHSEDDIFITGDIEYKNKNFQDPDAGPISDDLLGIISEGDVIVEKNAYNDNNDGKDLNIHASIMAMGESFTVEEFWQGDDNGWGQLNIYGGLIQQKRGPVALSSGPGYKKFYSYDERLLENSTPDFPKVKRFEITSWRETTTKVDNN